MAEDDTTRYVRSVDRAIDVLEALARGTQSMSLADIIRAVEAPKSTILNIVRTLAKRRILELDPATHCYRPGHLLAALAKNAPKDRNLAKMAQTHLEKLASSTRETTLFGIETGDEVVYIAVVNSPQPIQHVVDVGVRRPLHCASGGKVLLSLRPPTDWEDYIRRVGLFSYSSKTITDPGVFRAHLKKVRKQGHAISDSETIPDLTSMAVPVFAGEGGELLGVMVVAGPHFRVVRRKSELRRLLENAAKELTADMARL